MSHQQQAEKSRRVGTGMEIAGGVLLAWGLFGVLMTPDGDSTPAAAFVVAILGALLLVGGLVVRALRG